MLRPALISHTNKVLLNSQKKVSIWAHEKVLETDGSDAQECKCT